MGVTPELPLPAQVAARAELIVNTLQQTDYSYVENIDVDLGVYDCDCSQFANFVLSRVAPDHYEIVLAAAGEPVPRAFDYYDFFSALTPESAGGWRRVDFLGDAGRGDMISWRFPKLREGHDTGHVLFVAETPVLEDSGNFAVRVYDSASEPHFDDTRGTGPGQPASGVGSGFINFIVDGTGRPTAFQFSPNPGSDQFTSLPIAIARLEPR
jgi:hypothetical protein